MRSDYALYVVAIICFAIAIYTTTMPGDTPLYIYGILVVGIIFIGLGYMARPKTAALAPPKPSTSPPEPTPKSTTQPKEAPAEEPKQSSAKKRTRKKRTTRSRRKKTQ